MEEKNRISATSEKAGSFGAAQKKDHKLSVYNRKNVVVSGVSELVKSSPAEIILKIGTSVLSIFGRDFQIKKLLLDEGVVEADGEVYEFKYSGKREKIPLLKRLFK